MQWHNLLAACGAAAQLFSLPLSVPLLLPFQAEVCTLLLTKRKKMCRASWLEEDDEVEGSAMGALQHSVAAWLQVCCTLLPFPYPTPTPSARPVECACASIAFHLARRERGVAGSRKGCGCGAGCQSGWRTEAEHKDNNDNADIVAIFVACCMLQK